MGLKNSTFTRLTYGYPTAQHVGLGCGCPLLELEDLNNPVDGWMFTLIIASEDKYALWRLCSCKCKKQSGGCWCRCQFILFSPEVYQLQFINYTVVPAYSLYFIDSPGYVSIPFGIQYKPPIGNPPTCSAKPTVTGPVALPRPTSFSLASSERLRKAQILTASKYGIVDIGNDTLPGLSVFSGPTQQPPILPYPDSTLTPVPVSLPIRPIVG
jgi:hypothetical protein